MYWQKWMTLAVLAPMLTACGGNGDPPPAPVVRLCPQTLDYGTVFTGGAGSGELIKVQLDTTKMTYQITYLASPIPVTTGTVQPTRDAAPNNVMSGTLTDETGLPTTKLNQCTFRLNNGSLDPSRPARFFVGEGVMGGAIPGATIQFGGVIGVGVVDKTMFPYYPFIAFSSVETDLTKIAGTYNQLGYHRVPSQGFAPVAIDQQFVIRADGSYTETDNFGKKNGGQPLSSTALVNQPFTQRSDSPAFQSLNYLPQVPATTTSLDPNTAGKGILIVGRLRNQLVPIFIRAGAANASLQNNGSPIADDESGITMLSPRAAVTQGSQDGEYTGVDSAFDYRATAMIGAQATLLDPFNASQAALTRALNLNFAQTVPGVVTTVHTDAASGPATGKFIFTGGVFGFLDMVDASQPYFTVGAFVQ